MDLPHIKKQVDSFLSETSEVISNFKVDAVSMAKAVDKIIACHGKIITTGLGKAGHAAHKAASSFCSMGFPAVFLHPAEASHGDSGLLGKDDIILAFSTSGKTREVLETLDFAKNHVSFVIAITSHSDATIRKLADIVLDMGEIKEAGYLHMAPTTSILVMLMLSDMLCSLAADMKEFSITDFALHHHGGYLGAKARGENTSTSSSF